TSSGLGGRTECPSGTHALDLHLGGRTPQITETLPGDPSVRRNERPRMTCQSKIDGLLERLRAFLQAHGREFWALDLTTDLGIPVFASITRRTDGLPEQIMPGFGAHLDPKIALLRAVTEMNQMLSSPLLRREKGGDKEPVDPETDHWLE